MSHLSQSITTKDHLLGSPNAPIILVEYGDYQCPGCGLANPYISQLLKQFKGRLVYAFRHFPLQSVHPFAFPAAIAAEAAGQQHKFWDMHNLIFENQEDIDDQALIYYAEVLNLDIQRFLADLNRDDLKKKVEADLSSGMHSGVNGTPTFFINGNRFDGYDSEYESLAYAIENIE